MAMLEKGARRQIVDKSEDALRPELIAIIDALAKEQARRDHYAEQAQVAKSATPRQPAA